MIDVAISYAIGGIVFMALYWKWTRSEHKPFRARIALVAFVAWPALLSGAIVAHLAVLARVRRERRADRRAR